MPLTRANGNMYEDFVDYCWSPLVGGCVHNCVYCYARKNYERFGRKWGKVPGWSRESIYGLNLSGEVEIKFPKLPVCRIFVCHTTDLFSYNVPHNQIKIVLDYCLEQYKENNYISFVFQTKNPGRLREFADIFSEFPGHVLTFGITLESDIHMKGISNAPRPIDRAFMFNYWIHDNSFGSFISIEPIMDFNLNEFVCIMEQLMPDMVFIGADSKKSGLKEPSAEKVSELITVLREFTDVRLKKNLNRLLDIAKEGEKCQREFQLKDQTILSL